MKNAGVLKSEKVAETAPAASVESAVSGLALTEGEALKQERKSVLGQMKLEDLEQERLIVKKTEKKTVAKKTTDKPVSAEVVKEDAKAVDVKAETKTADVKTEEKDAAAKTETKAAPAKTTKAEAKTAKTETKEATAKPAAATKAKASAKSAAKTIKQEITLQVDGREDMMMDTLIDKVKAAYVAEGHSADTIQTIAVYIKLSENMAYYVINKDQPDEYASGTVLYQ